MKSSKVKVVVIAFVSFLIIVGAAIGIASSKLKPEEIKKIALEKTQEVFPGAEVAIGEIQISWGLNFKVGMSKFSLNNKTHEKHVPMISVNDLQIKVPVWSVLFGGGTIEIKLDAPQMHYQEFESGDNWSTAMKPSTESAPEAATDAGSSEKKSNLSALRKIKLNFKLSDIDVSYELKDQSKGQIKVSKFLINGLNISGPTAFEVASNARFVMADKSTTSFDTLIIGQFNLAEYEKSQTLPLMSVVKLNNFSFSKAEYKIPEITTEFEATINKDNSVQGKFETSFEGSNKVSAKFSKSTLGFSLKDLVGEIILKDVQNMLGLKDIDLSKAKLSFKGDISVDELKQKNPNISFVIEPGIGFSKDGFSASTTVNGEYKGTSFSAATRTSAMEGSVTVAAKGSYDLNKPFDMATLEPIDIKVKATGLRLSEPFIRGRLYANNEKIEKLKKEEQEAAKSKQVEQASQVKLPPTKIALDWSSVNIAGEDFSGNGVIKTTINTLAIENLNFKFSKGQGKLNQTLVLSRFAKDTKFQFDLVNLNLNSLKPFLPPFVENFAGNFSGKVGGSARVSVSKEPIYDVDVNVEAVNGELKKVNVTEYLQMAIASIPMIKDKIPADKVFKIDGGFDQFSLKGKFTQDKYNLQQFKFVASKKVAEIEGSGEIRPLGGSFVESTFLDNTGKISAPLEKNTGTKILPLRFQGQGFMLKPDYEYSMKKLAKGALKTKGTEKIQEAAQKGIEKVADKFLKGAAKDKVDNLLKDGETKEKVNKLLKGLFK